MKRILSGIQTSGRLHLGNYLGSIKNWVNLQDKYKCYLFLADLHSQTVKRDPKEILEASYETIASYIASGIDPDKSILFNQSSVPAHSELMWIFSCLTPIGWLNRMTQFKDKAGKDKEKASAGLYIYPILMAADILLYKPTLVPVGEDQKQHIELAREIAGAFNRFTKKEYFLLPEPLIMGNATRVMSLKDGKSKMSKSDSSDNSRINLVDDEDIIIKKFKKAKTDNFDKIFVDKELRPEITNLINIFSSFSGNDPSNIADEYSELGFAKFKGDLAELVAMKIAPISQEIKRLMADKGFLKKILKEGSQKANESAEIHLREIKQLFGFITY